MHQRSLYSNSRINTALSAISRPSFLFPFLHETVHPLLHYSISFVNYRKPLPLLFFHSPSMFLMNQHSLFLSPSTSIVKEHTSLHFSYLLPYHLTVSSTSITNQRIISNLFPLPPALHSSLPVRGCERWRQRRVFGGPRRFTKTYAALTLVTFPVATLGSGGTGGRGGEGLPCC